jgi:hypothetical protein
MRNAGTLHLISHRCSTLHHVQYSTVHFAVSICKMHDNSLLFPAVFLALLQTSILTSVSTSGKITLKSCPSAKRSLAGTLLRHANFNLFSCRPISHIDRCYDSTGGTCLYCNDQSLSFAEKSYRSSSQAYKLKTSM